MTQETFKENVKNLEIRDKEGNLRLKQVPLFEEQFPSLKGMATSYELTNRPDGIKKQVRVFSELDIQSNCLDKQKVRDAIENVKEWDECGEPGCCDRFLTPEEIKDKIKKELGL